MKHPIIQLLAFMLLAAIDATRSIVGRTAIMANSVPGTVQASPGTKNYYAESALTAHTLVKQGTAANEVLPCGAGDRPIGWVEDDADADTMASVKLFGSARETGVILSSGDIVAGEPVYTAAAGVAQDLPTATGTYYEIGTALTAAGDGEEFEFDPRAPITTAVS
ncbi:DUF2190 family protein [Coraliomargarita sp. W4R72]